MTALYSLQQSELGIINFLCNSKIKSECSTHCSQPQSHPRSHPSPAAGNNFSQTGAAAALHPELICQAFVSRAPHLAELVTRGVVRSSGVACNFPSPPRITKYEILTFEPDYDYTIKLEYFNSRNGCNGFCGSAAPDLASGGWWWEVRYAGATRPGAAVLIPPGLTQHCTAQAQINFKRSLKLRGVFSHDPPRSAKRTCNYPKLTRIAFPLSHCKNSNVQLLINSWYLEPVIISPPAYWPTNWHQHNILPGGSAIQLRIGRYSFITRRCAESLGARSLLLN